MSYLYDCLTRYGDCYALKQSLRVTDVQNALEQYKDKWVQYNPRKKINRQGLSITSLDGGLSGIPDLDSVKEWNIKHNVNLDEEDFTQKTELWPIVENALKPYEKFLGRTHFIRMGRTGCFPTHRDQFKREVKSLRLFIPIVNCNPPHNYFILDDKILNFDHGQVYFLNTCKEHTTFTVRETSIFVVANVVVSEQSVDTILKNLNIL